MRTSERCTFGGCHGCRPGPGDCRYLMSRLGGRARGIVKEARCAGSLGPMLRSHQVNWAVVNSSGDPTMPWYKLHLSAVWISCCRSGGVGPVCN